MELSRGLTTILAIAAGVAVANIYYNQPMLADMAATLHVSPHEIGYVATATQLGYAAGMPLFIPLGDFLERRSLIVLLFLAVACALAGAALSTSLLALVITSFLIGATTVIAQVIIPLASELAAPEQQGRIIGTILSGVLLGILLARTLSGFIAAHFGWRAMFWLAAGMSIVFAALLRMILPHIPVRSRITYRELMHSIWMLLLELPKLRQVSFVAGMFFAAFSAFWTTLVFLLKTPPYHYGSEAAGLFGLVGAVGATVAPISGRLSDQHSPRFVVRIAIGIVLAAFAVFWGLAFQLWGLVIGVILLDAGAQAAQVANQSRVLKLKPEARNRVNTVYMICYFGGGSVGSLLGSIAWTRFQWTGVCATGIAFMVLAAIALIVRGPEPNSAQH
ncbi:MAG TPA: MFS transporter [Bryobacteraceae bacterium]|nr:MFS transporter [Bryobacteraceae bacterium]